MPVPNAIVLVLLNDEVIVDVTFARLLERTQYCAAITLASHRAEQPLSIDIEDSSTVCFWTLDHFNTEAL